MAKAILERTEEETEGEEAETSFEKSPTMRDEDRVSS